MGTKNSKTQGSHRREPSRDESLAATQKTGTVSKPRHRSNMSDTSVASTWIYKDLPIADYYELHETIAYGYLGKIRICSRKRHQYSDHNGNLVVDGLVETSAESSSSQHNKKTSYHRLYACKSISLSRMTQEETTMDQLLAEVTALRDLTNPSIISIREVFYGKRQIKLVTELCMGGDLFARMDTNNELDVCDIMEQLVQAVGYLHLQGTCHRRIQLENVLYEHAGFNAGIKLIDFGLSDKYGRAVRTLQVCGVPYAAAPEVQASSSSSYTASADMWSIGVVAFVLLSGGTYPFGTDSEMDLERLEAAKYTFGPEWEDRSVSNFAKTFCENCLCQRPNDRWTAEDANEYIRSKWMPTIEEKEQSESSEYNMPTSSECSLRGMQDFGLYGELKKRILMTMANTMDKSSLAELKDACMDVDSTGKGSLTIGELMRAMELFQQQEGDSSELTNEDITEMFTCNEHDRSGPIQYVEFLDAVLETQGMMTQERLGEAFDRADREGKGYISKEDMKRILGPNCDLEVTGRMMEEADLEKSGCVKYDEFLRLMFNDPAKAMDYVDRVVDPL